jgi:uncharacterized protein GlcG (DUF336 family)
VRRIRSSSIAFGGLLSITMGSAPARADVQPCYLQDEADRMVETCFRYAAEQKWTPLSAVIVDDSGPVVELKRQKDASALTAEVAVLKAKSAIRTGASTATLSTQDTATREFLALLQLTAAPGGGSDHARPKANGRRRCLGCRTRAGRCLCATGGGSRSQMSGPSVRRFERFASGSEHRRGVRCISDSEPTSTRHSRAGAHGCTMPPLRPGKLPGHSYQAWTRLVDTPGTAGAWASSDASTRTRSTTGCVPCAAD